MLKNSLGSGREIALRWMSLDLTGDKSTLIKVMSWGSGQQSFTWANICRHMASQGHNGFLNCLTPQGKLTLFLNPVMCDAFNAPSGFYKKTQLNDLN